MPKWLINGLMLAAGASLLYWVFAVADIDAAIASATSIGIGGFGAVLGIFLLGFMLDVVVWMLVLGGRHVSPVWFWRLFKARMLGEAINITTPVAGFGGEPAKAWLLNRRHGLSYVEVISSMITATTVTVVGLVAFLGIGLTLMAQSDAFDPEAKIAGAAGFGLLATGILGFFLVQRFQLTTSIARWAHGRTGLAWLETAAEKITLVDRRLAGFYAARPWRLFGVVAIAGLAYAVSIGEVYVAMHAMEVPVTLAEAWIIEAAAQLVRAAAFMIPGALGAQDGAFVFATLAITGQPHAGVAVALVRRAREIFWVVVGAVIGLREWLLVRTGH